jgi:hypothetical protein
MDDWRGRMLVAAAVAIALLVGSRPTPVEAAECRLSAPATSTVGTILTVNGSGFPAVSSVEIVLTTKGQAPQDFSVQTDSSGNLAFSLTPEAADLGETTVVATAGSTCSVQVQITILAKGQAAPTATAKAARATPDHAATVPSTDAASNDLNIIGSGGSAWLAGGFLLLLGVIGLLATRPARGRSSP